MKPLAIAVIGVGHLGKEHARILSGLEQALLVAVADANRSQAEAIAERCNTRACPDYRDLIGKIDAAVIAASTSMHHPIAMDLVKAGIHVLVEKPITTTNEQAEELVSLAEKQGVVVQVGHIERFNPAYEDLVCREMRPCYISAQRCGGFTGRSLDVGVVLDLMIHDIDLVLGLVQSTPTRVEAMGVAMLGGHEDIAQARITFANGCVADIMASRTHPEPRRGMQVWGPEGYARIDFAKRQLTLMQPNETLRQGRLDSRRLDPAMLNSLKAELYGRYVQTLELDSGKRYRADQLTRELEDFVDCARQKRQPRCDGRAGANALRLATDIMASLRSHAWEGRVDGPTGPNQLPSARGRLFATGVSEAA